MPRPAISLRALAPLIAAIFIMGCERPAPPRPDDEAIAMTTTTRADRPVSEEGYLAAVRREQRGLDLRLDDAVTRIDRRLAAHVAAERPALLEARRRLIADRRLIEKSDERGWDELKAEIERDLAVHGDGS